MYYFLPLVWHLLIMLSSHTETHASLPPITAFDYSVNRLIRTQDMEAAIGNLLDMGIKIESPR